MANFVKLDDSNVTITCILVDDNDCLDQNGNFSESVGATFCHNLVGGNWVQTFKDGGPRKNYAGGAGWIWDIEKNMFYKPQPFPSWTLNEETGKWISPQPLWEDGKLKIWMEDEERWVYVENINEIPDGTIIEGTFPSYASHMIKTSNVDHIPTINEWE